MNSKRFTPTYSPSGRAPTAGSAAAAGAAAAGAAAAAVPAAATRAVFPHESLDVHQVLVAAYQAVMSWRISFSKGTTGDQLKRAVQSALLRYTEGYYAQGGNRGAHFAAARASAGEAGAAALSLVLERNVGSADAEAVRLLLARGMAMLHRLARRT